MTNAERHFALALRLIGGVFGFAAFLCVFLPHSWMNSAHQSLVGGALPDIPIVGYLTRSLSAFYALFLFLMFYLSFDLRRNRTLLILYGCVTSAFAILLLGIDYFQNMPLSWTLGEGPPTAVFGLVIAWLTVKLVPKSD